MNAMGPVWEFLDRLEGFELVAFWIAAPVLTAMMGFALDYLLQRQGFGFVFNTLYVGVGVCLGLYVRYNYLRTYQTLAPDPYLTISAITCVTVALFGSMSLLRNRLP